jgi:hypothetical protein
MFWGRRYSEPIFRDDVFHIRRQPSSDKTSCLLNYVSLKFLAGEGQDEG